MRKTKDLQPLEMLNGQRVSFGTKEALVSGVSFCLSKRSSPTGTGAAENDGTFWSGGKHDFT